MSRAEMLHAENKKNLDQLDQGLDALSNITGTMQQNAGQIGNELTSQIEMTKDISNRMDTTNGSIKKGTTGLGDVSKMSKGGWTSWIIMILLIIACVVCLIAPIPKIKKE